MIVVDLELTGLDRRSDQIIAIGWTLIDEGRIRMGGNRHILVATDQSVGASAAIHELLDNEIAHGEPIEYGLEALFRAATGRLWVFHHASLDIGFLKEAVRKWTGATPGFVVLDTLQIEHSRRHRRDVPVHQGDMQLSKLRQEYGLPRYKGHHALSDAFATAELTLAIAARLEPDEPLKLKPYLRYY
jgi:DNA polymerase-3 subunit epsilon